MKPTRLSMPYGSARVNVPTEQTCIDVPWKTNSRWINNVRLWNFSATVSLTSGGPPIFNFTNTEVGWNFDNNRAFFPSNPGAPSNEGHLATGWQIRYDQSFGADSVSLLLYNSDFGFISNRAGQGATFSTPENDVTPWFQIRFISGAFVATSQSEPPVPSDLIGDIDGVPIAFADSGGAGAMTGNVSLQPKKYWPYANEDGSDPDFDEDTGDPI